MLPKEILLFNENNVLVRRQVGSKGGVSSWIAPHIGNLL